MWSNIVIYDIICIYIYIYRDIAPQFLGNRLYQIMIFLGINDVILHWFNPKPLR